MTIISFLVTPQDTVQIKNAINIDSTGVRPDSTVVIKTLQPDVIQNDSLVIKYDSVALTGTSREEDSPNLIQKSPPKEPKIDIIDTTSVCSRNSIIDITFYNSNNVFANSKPELLNRFPFILTEGNRQKKIDAKASLIGHLKSGEDLPTQPLHEDWILGIILIAAFLYSLIRTTSKVMLPGVSRFFMFRGINDPSSRDVEKIFHWQSTMHNLFSFLIIGVFAYSAISYYHLIPNINSGILLWLISFGIIITAVTLRHIVCAITGNISGEKEVFREYLTGIYQSYRLSALFLFVLVVLLLYTRILSTEFIIISGLVLFGIFYLLRVIRLMLIFINRKISIFYLILYLCGLEILPVLISVKYFAGLI